MNNESNELKLLRTESIDPCILCGDASCARRDQEFEKLLGLVSPYAVNRCENCSLRWLTPRPTKDAYRIIYSNRFYFNGECSPEDYRKVVSERLHHFRCRLKKIEAVLGGSSGKVILDIGAATGEFLKIAMNLGFSIEGIEFSGDARKTSMEKNHVKLSDVEPHELGASTFDVVHMNHVLEHMLDPFECLNDCFRILKPGGILVIEVPQQFYNSLDTFRRFIGNRKEGKFDSYSLHHTYFFNPTNLVSLVSKAGFNILSIKTAVSSRTPLIPFRFKNMFLRFYLYFSDFFAKNGNVIEVYAKKLD